MAKKITIYTTPTCAWSKKAKEFFKKKRLSFEEKDLVKDEIARDEILIKSGQIATPVIEIESEILVGFNESEMEKVLTKK